MPLMIFNRLRLLTSPVKRAFRFFHRPLHARKTRPFYALFIQPGDLVFDVGANVGERTEIFLQLGAKVVSVEPQRECVRRLYIRFHDHPDVRIIPRAIGSKEGMAEMLVSYRYHPSSSINPTFAEAMERCGRYGASHWDEARTVKMTTLDALIDEFGVPSFVKIDVEGYEHEVFKGLSHPVKAFSFEFQPLFLGPALGSIDSLKRFGPARYNYAIEERMELVLDPWKDANEMAAILKSLENTREFIYGDVYAVFDGSSRVPR